MTRARTERRMADRLEVITREAFPAESQFKRVKPCAPREVPFGVRLDFLSCLPTVRLEVSPVGPRPFRGALPAFAANTRHAFAKRAQCEPRALWFESARVSKAASEWRFRIWCSSCGPWPS
eukprot:scaffold952_cov249-Pinguiococcus_pyrenoidosus.AAC.18